LSAAWDASGLELPPGVRIEQQSGTSLWFHVDRPQESNPLIVDALSAGRAPVVTFQEVPRSLEQVYLKVMADVQAGAYVA
jgi:ABC-2 type transport system ATP-binding protein